MSDLDFLFGLSDIEPPKSLVKAAKTSPSKIKQIDWESWCSKPLSTVQQKEYRSLAIKHGFEIMTMTNGDLLMLTAYEDALIDPKARADLMDRVYGKAITKQVNLNTSLSLDDYLKSLQE